MSAIVVKDPAKDTAYFPFTLAEALEGLPKDVLTTIRQNAAIKNVSKLNRELLKAACVAQLPKALAIELPFITELFDRSRIQVLSEAVKRNGIFIINHEITEQEIQYWKQLGLLFYQERNNQKMLLMPIELIDIVKQHLSKLDMQKMDQNQLLIETVKGMLYFYGCLTYQQLEELIKRYEEFGHVEASIMHLVIHYRHYKSEYQLNDQYVYHKSIPDPTLIVREQQQRASLSFAQFTVAQLTQAAQPTFAQRNQAHRLLVERLKNQLSLQLQDAVLVADQCEFGIRAGLQLNDLVQYISQQLVITDEEQLKKILPSIVLLFNQTSQWLLKGHTSASLTKGVGNTVPIEPAAASVPSIGRNDLCYCGSGKKFKKCCLHK